MLLKMSTGNNRKDTMKKMPPLKIRRMPDRRLDPLRRTEGKLSGLGVMEYWHYLFEYNELKEPPTDRMNDETIVEQMEQEFPDRPQVTQRIHEKKVTVGFFRWKYNNGVLCPVKGMPRRKSYRYNENGLRINGMTRKILPKSQQPKKRRRR